MWLQHSDSYLQLENFQLEIANLLSGPIGNELCWATLILVGFCRQLSILPVGIRDFSNVIS